MPKLCAIPVEELVTDYYDSAIDAKVCDRLGRPDRASGNRRIMGIIRGELKRRNLEHLIERGRD